MQIQTLINFLETIAPPSLQESYDNTGLQTGSPAWTCTGVLVTLDVTESVVEEAERRNCNLIVAHHPLIFKPLKRLQTNNPAARTLVQALKKDIAVYAIHTNLDNIADGVNDMIAQKLGLDRCSTLLPLRGHLRKLVTFVPSDHLVAVREAIFATGAGWISNYSSCSFSSSGTGTFQAEAGAQPVVGKPGTLHEEPEHRLELVFPAHLEGAVQKALREAHPYEEVAYDIISLNNSWNGAGSGRIGYLRQPIPERDFLTLVRDQFHIPVIRHSVFLDRDISKVAVCGGAGSFLIATARQAGADAFLTADLKYHEFFEADQGLLLADFGHFESEQFTSDLLVGRLLEKFPNFAVLKTDVKTNPVRYFYR